MALIRLEHITRDYGDDRGVFDLSFDIARGEVFGFLGPNGAGKTTTIRQLLGFIRPDRGKVLINGKEVRCRYHETNAHIGYLPGEISFPEGMKGTEYIRWCAALRGMKDLGRAPGLISLLDLKNADGDLRRMSKGMKQKIGIVCAFMHDPDMLVLDEPTSGLDPLMQEAFIGLIREEKKRGKTILMSSHMFTEIEKTCDRTAILRGGRLAAVVDMARLRKSSRKEYRIGFASREDSLRFAGEGFDLAGVSTGNAQALVRIDDADINRLIAVLSGYEVRFISEIKQTLEDCFMHYYDTRAGQDGAQ
ncbi:MAG: ABC transporter ATP-binding protein [Aristaeellaceae bacterium]